MPVPLLTVPRRAVFDVDETLLQSHEPYLLAKEAVLAALRSQWPGLQAERFLAHLEAIEQERLPRLGFTAERFAGSLLLAAEAVAQEYGSDLGEAAQTQVRHAGEFVPTWDYRPYPYALETLTALKAAGVRLGVCTKASDRAFQERKLARWGLDTLADTVHIVPRKGAAELAAVLADLGPDAPSADDVMVGDSLRDDIASGTALGLRTAWIRHAQPATREVRVWSYDAQTPEVQPTATFSALAPLAPWMGVTPRYDAVRPATRRRSAPPSRRDR